MNIKILLFIVILIPTVSASECPKNVYYLTPGYVFADGNLVFKFIDMDLSKDGFQETLTARPGELVTVEVKWEWGPNCPECTVYINSFGGWDSKNDIMKLYSGPKSKVRSVSRNSISFQAPGTSGVYKFRVIFAYDKEYAADFDASNLCSAEECQIRGECNVLVAEGDINVTMLSASGKIPLSIELTSPKTSAVSGILKTNLGSVIPIDAVVDRPPNTTINITVKIDDSKVSSLLPYSWNTFNSSTGSHRIVVTAKDENGTLVTDEIKVLLLNKTGTYGVTPPLVWRQRLRGIVKDLDISEKGSYTVAGSDDGFVYLFDRTGKKIWEYSLSDSVNSVAMNSDGKKLIFTSGNVLYYVNGDGTLIWTYSSSTDIKSVDMNRNGDRIASASGNVLYYVNGNGSLLWTYSTSNPITSVAVNGDGSKIASASGNVMYYLNGDGTLIWTYSSSTDIKSVDMNRNGDRIAFASGNVLYYMDNLASLLWNLTDVTDAAISSDGSLILAKSNNKLLAIKKGGSIIWRDVSENVLGTISVSSDGKFLTYSEGESVLLRGNSQITIPEQSRSWIYVAIALLAVLVVGIFIKMKKIPFVRLKTGIKRAESGEDSREAPPVTAPVEVATLKVRVINHETKRPINAAKIHIGDIITDTNEDGEAMVKDMQFGEHVITVEKQLYHQGQETCVVGDGENFTEIALIPSVETDTKNEETLKSIMNNLSRAYEKVSRYDTCLPNYYKSIGERIVEFLEMLSYSPELIEVEERREFIDSFVEVGAMTCNGLLDVITDWRNVKLYQAASELERSDCDAKEVKVEALHAIFTNPESVRREIESRLSTLDNKMMDHMDKLTIIPVSTLWKVSKELLREPSTESGYKKLAMLFFANVLASYTNDMFENEEIVKRLKFALL